MSDATPAQLLQKYENLVQYKLGWWVSPAIGWLLLVINFAIKVLVFCLLVQSVAEKRLLTIHLTGGISESISQIVNFAVTATPELIVIFLAWIVFRYLALPLDTIVYSFSSKFFLKSTVEATIKNNHFALFLRNFQSDPVLIETSASTADVVSQLSDKRDEIDTIMGIGREGHVGFDVTMDAATMIFKSKDVLLLVFLFVWRRLVGWTPESSIQEVLPSSMKMIAIGKPGDSAFRGVATRVFVEDSAWKDVALDLIRQSALIIFRFDGTLGGNLRWEYEQLMRLENRKKSVFITIDDRAMPLLWKSFTSIPEVAAAGNPHGIKLGSVRPDC
jgi:hypothetical protein